MMHRDSIINSLLLLFLSLSGNFLGSTMSCQFQYHVTNNVLLKHILLIFIIFFTLNFIDTGNNHPLYSSLATSIVVWILYVLFTKQTFLFTIVSLVLIMVIYVNYTIIQYNHKHNKDLQTVDFHNILQDIAYPMLVGTIILGNIVYLARKYKQYGSQFSLVTYYMGTTTCLKMKGA